jgi:hypothetical protein
VLFVPTIYNKPYENKQANSWYKAVGCNT